VSTIGWPIRSRIAATSALGVKVRMVPNCAMHSEPWQPRPLRAEFAWLAAMHRKVHRGAGGRSAPAPPEPIPPPRVTREGGTRCQLRRAERARLRRHRPGEPRHFPALLTDLWVAA